MFPVDNRDAAIRGRSCERSRRPRPPADLDGLVRLVDTFCTNADWPSLLSCATRRAAVTTGRQLWPAATLAEYRLALWAPAEWATQVLDEDSGTVHDRAVDRGGRRRTISSAISVPHFPMGPRRLRRPRMCTARRRCFRPISPTHWTSRSRCNRGSRSTASPSTATMACPRGATAAGVGGVRGDARRWR